MDKLCPWCGQPGAHVECLKAALRWTFEKVKDGPVGPAIRLDLTPGGVSEWTCQGCNGVMAGDMRTDPDLFTHEDGCRYVAARELAEARKVN